jgi:hypothetical protein
MASRFSIQRLTVISFSHRGVAPHQFTPVRGNSIVARVADAVDVTGGNDRQRRLSAVTASPAPAARKFPEAPRDLLPVSLKTLVCPRFRGVGLLDFLCHVSEAVAWDDAGTCDLLLITVPPTLSRLR